jgi:hypothetical protein
METVEFLLDVGLPVSGLMAVFWGARHEAAREVPGAGVGSLQCRAANKKAARKALLCCSLTRYSF